MVNLVVHVVDDDPALRDSIQFFLETDGRYSARLFCDGREFLDACQDLTDGIVLLDIRMPELSGLEVQALLNARGSTLPVIVMAGMAEVGQAVQAMKAGAHDFLEKPFDPDQLLAALDAAMESRRIAVPDHQVARVAEERVARLSPRERDVLIGLIDGLPNKIIAFQLGLSVRTVELHRAHMMQRLAVRSLSEAVRLALAAGLPPTAGATFRPR